MAIESVQNLVRSCYSASTKNTIQYWWFACDVMAAMLVYRNNKIFLLWELLIPFLCKLQATPDNSNPR